MCTVPSAESARCMPVPELVYAQSATTRSSLRSARAGSVMRPSAQTAAGSSAAPLSAISRTPVAIRSAWVVAPGSRQSNRISETEPNVSGPPVKSKSTSYERTRSSRARSVVWSRVMSASIAPTLARALPPDQVKDAAQLAVRVAPAGLEFDRGLRPHLRRIGWVELDAAELEPVGEQPHPVPAQRLDAAALQELAESLHRVGATLDAEHADLGGGV